MLVVLDMGADRSGAADQDCMLVEGNRKEESRASGKRPEIALSLFINLVNEEIGERSLSIVSVIRIAVRNMFDELPIR